MEPTRAQLLLREHEASRSKIKHLVDFTSEQGEEIAVRVRQQVRVFGQSFNQKPLGGRSVPSCKFSHAALRIK